MPATAVIAAHCDGYCGRTSATMRTARSRSSSGYLLTRPITQILPRSGASGNAGTGHTTSSGLGNAARMALTFVLIHGSWHDGSAWYAVKRCLQTRGHTVYAPAVAGHGKGSRRDIGHDEAARSVVDFIVNYDIADCVLVGHSGGGITISKVVEAIPYRVRRLVYLSGFVLRDGEGQADFV